MYTLQPENKDKKYPWGILFAAIGVTILLTFAMVALFGIAFGILLIISMKGDPPDRAGACEVTRSFVSSHLNLDYRTTTYPEWTEENCIATENDGVWTIRSFVDTQDSSGVTRRYSYVVQARYDVYDYQWIGRVTSIDGVAPYTSEYRSFFH